MYNGPKIGRKSEARLSCGGGAYLRRQLSYCLMAPVGALFRPCTPPRLCGAGGRWLLLFFVVSTSLLSVHLLAATLTVAGHRVWVISPISEALGLWETAEMPCRALRVSSTVRRGVGE